MYVEYTYVGLIIFIHFNSLFALCCVCVCVCKIILEEILFCTMLEVHMYVH